MKKTRSFISTIDNPFLWLSIVSALVCYLWGTHVPADSPEALNAELANASELEVESMTAARTFSTDELLYAIRQTESGGKIVPEDGDGGRSIGPYQISRSYFIDSLVRGSYQDCRNRPFAETVVAAYFDRYQPGRFKNSMTLLDCQILARIHNGGPHGARKSATAAYWRKVRDVLLHN